MTEKNTQKNDESLEEKMLLSYLGVSEKEWKKFCVQYPELDTLKPGMLKRHFKENAEGLGFENKVWGAVCKKTPELYEMNLATLKKHISENAKLMGVSEDEWIKICKFEPGLFIYNCETLKKNLKNSATALGISEDRWRTVCQKRGTLLTYKPETLVNKIDQFIEYVHSPLSLLKKQSEPSETMVHTLTQFKGMSLDRKKVLNAFLRHYNNFLSSAEKMAYSFAYISLMTKAFDVDKDEYCFLSYVDLPVESNLKMHYLYACLQRHKDKEVSFSTLVGEQKKNVKQRLSEASETKEKKTDEEIISEYPCPFLKRLKKFYS